MALGQYLARAAVLARGVVSAVALGPQGFGSWNALNLVLDYGQYASLGALQGLDLRLPGAVVRGEAAAARSLMAGAWGVVVAGALSAALVLAALLARGVPALTTGLGWQAPALMLAAAWLQLAIQYHASVLKARGRFQVVSGALAAQALVGGGLGIALVFRLGIWGLLAGWLAGGVLALAWLRVATPGAPWVPGAWREGLRLALTGLPVFGFFAASLVLRSVDRLAFVRYGDREGLGHYSLGLMAAGLVLYVPEAVAAVLYPRIAAAAEGARDDRRTRDEVARAHRAISVLLPLPVALAIVWAPPLVAQLLPAYRDGVVALQVLAFGALALSTATVPAYWLLGSGRARELLAAGIAGAGLNALLVFGVAASDPRPTSIAIAATAGYTMFAAGMVTLAARELFARGSARAAFAWASFVPVAWLAAATLAAMRVGPAESVGGALLRTVGLVVAYVPVLIWFGRGLGLRSLAGAWRGMKGRT